MIEVALSDRPRVILQEEAMQTQWRRCKVYHSRSWGDSLWTSLSLYNRGNAHSTQWIAGSGFACQTITACEFSIWDPLLRNDYGRLITFMPRASEFGYNHTITGLKFTRLLKKNGKIDATELGRKSELGYSPVSDSKLHTFWTLRPNNWYFIIFYCTLFVVVTKALPTNFLPILLNEVPINYYFFFISPQLNWNKLHLPGFGSWSFDMTFLMNSASSEHQFLIISHKSIISSFSYTLLTFRYIDILCDFKSNRVWFASLHYTFIRCIPEVSFVFFFLLFIITSIIIIVVFIVVLRKLLVTKCFYVTFVTALILVGFSLL